MEKPYEIYFKILRKIEKSKVITKSKLKSERDLKIKKKYVNYQYIKQYKRKNKGRPKRHFIFVTGNIFDPNEENVYRLDEKQKIILKDEILKCKNELKENLYEDKKKKKKIL